jgi:hypothetical protein
MNYPVARGTRLPNLHLYFIRKGLLSGSEGRCEGVESRVGEGRPEGIYE